MLVRPCIMVVDPPVDGGISSRKLVLESAGYNVIACYSCDEAIATLERFPRVHAVVVNAVMHETECATLLREVRDRFPGPLRLVVGKLDRASVEDADDFVDSYSPKTLLYALHRFFPSAPEEKGTPQQVQSTA